MTGDTNLKAIFSNTKGIEEAEDGYISVYVREGCIVVEGADGETITVYDIVGRAMPSVHSPLPNGIFIIKVGIRPTHKVAVIR